MTTLKSKKTQNISVSATEAKESHLSPPKRRHPLDKVIGVFKDEPLMDALMERIADARQAERDVETTAD